MAMQTGTSGVNSDINVTPFVDICLVLLIIFMVVTPLMSRTLDVSVPPKVDTAPTDVVTADQLILTVKGPPESPKVLLNREEIAGALDGVQTRMEELMKGRREKVVFFQADNDVPYDYVVKVLDAMRGGNVEKIGLVTDEALDATATPAQ
ncbi:MAG TPA: biopolymer transporter ExbD [Candidatus Cryosericum sp.]|nr:biopolymer transporter ExbD [Candidatus Cryosericum sp.]